MKKSRHTESQMVNAIHQLEQVITADLALDNRILKDVLEKKL